mmetsp:Transcript_65664/g.142512  ORF Transcript_65664/g.142512 Transcript_65664/m.142512 type:complete len:253 (-) Transcript_65664:376-1134(-)
MSISSMSSSLCSSSSSTSSTAVCALLARLFVFAFPLAFTALGFAEAKEKPPPARFGRGAEGSVLLLVLLALAPAATALALGWGARGGGLRGLAPLVGEALVGGGVGVRRVGVWLVPEFGLASGGCASDFFGSCGVGRGPGVGDAGAVSAAGAGCAGGDVDDADGVASNVGGFVDSVADVVASIAAAPPAAVGGLLFSGAEPGLSGSVVFTSRFGWGSAFWGGVAATVSSIFLESFTSAFVATSSSTDLATCC